MASVAARFQPTALSGSLGRRPAFAIASGVAAAGVAAVVALLGFEVAGRPVAQALDVPIQAAAMLAAGISCGLLARKSRGRLRTAWALIGAAPLLALGAGAAAFAYYGALLNVAVPYPSPADAVFLIAALVTLAGVLSFPSSPTHTSGRARMAIDALVIAISMLFVSWAFGLGDLYQQQHVGWFTATVAIGYPAIDMVTLTVLLLIIRRAPHTKYGRLALLATGLLLELIANASYATSFANQGHSAGTSWADVAFVAGLIGIGLAAWTPAGPAGQQVTEAPATLWRMMMPWLGLVAVMVTVVIVTLLHRTFDLFLIYPSIALAVLLMASQLVSYRETLRFLGLSKDAEARLKAQTQVLNEVIAHAPLGVARVGLDDHVLDANPRLGELLHAPMRILLGADVKEFLQRVETPDHRERYRGLMKGDVDTVEEEGPVRRADGSSVWLHWSTTAVRHPDRSLAYFITMVEDMSARHDSEEAAMANLLGLERLNKLKSEFVSMVSHEFRTALVGIQGFSELIRDESLEISDIKDLAGDINNDAQRLNRMIGEMLDLDRMEAGKIRLELKPLNLNGLLEDAVERAQMSSEAHHVSADLDLALPIVTGDSDRIVQVVSNLLSNAVKYAPNGGDITLTSRLEGDSVHVSVQDEGSGIPQEFLGKVFGRYERFESNRASKVTGTGLGLAISRQIVELHGGRIWVESELGRGSTFHFTIPLGPRRAEPASS